MRGRTASARPKRCRLLVAAAFKGFNKSLCADVLVPCAGKALMLVQEVADKDIVLAFTVAGVLLHSHVVVAKVERCKNPTHAKRIGKLEAHLRVAHQVA